MGAKIRTAQAAAMGPAPCVECEAAAKQLKAPAAAGGPSVRVASRTEKAWIGITLVDDAGEPVPGEDFQVVLPDGRAMKGSLDSQGRVRIEGVPAGTCQVSFPSLDGGSWIRRS